MNRLQLLRISFRVAGLVHVSKSVTIEVPYAKGVDMWKLEQKGKLPPATKEAIMEIVRGHGGKHPKYEEDGLFFDVDADKAESAAEDIEHLHGVDKSFKSLFDVKELLKRTRPKERPEKEKKPSKAEKKADKLLAEADKQEEPKKAPAKPEAKKPEAKKPEAKKAPPPKAPAPEQDEDNEDHDEDWNDLANSFGVPARNRRPPKDDSPKPRAKGAPAKPKGKGQVFRPKRKDKDKPPPMPSHSKVVRSVDNLRKSLDEDDDQDAFMDAVKDFLSVINYQSWA